MTGEFLLFKKNTAIKSYPEKCLKVSKELKRLSEDVQKFVKKTTLVKYYLQYNPQASKCTRKLTTLQLYFTTFMSSFMG